MVEQLIGFLKFKNKLLKKKYNLYDMNNLIRELTKLGGINDLQKCIHLVKQYSSLDYKNWISYNKYSYKRNLIYRDDNYEILLLCWNPYSLAKIHDHSQNGCILKLLSGNLIETKYDSSLNIIGSSLITPNSISYISNEIGYHSINNLNNKSISLHIYSPPNYRSRFVN